MVKFLKPNKVVDLKKHAEMVKFLIRKDSAKKQVKKSRVKCFVKMVNYNHMSAHALHSRRFFIPGHHCCRLPLVAVPCPSSLSLSLSLLHPSSSSLARRRCRFFIRRRCRFFIRRRCRFFIHRRCRSRFSNLVPRCCRRPSSIQVI